MKKTERNTKAEEFEGVLIPKDNVLCVGIESVAVFQNTVMQGDFKGRQCDKYKVTLRVLEPGEFNGKRSSVSITAQTERRVAGSGEVMIDNYGNSKKYVLLLKAIDPSVTDDALPMPESDDEAKSWGESWVGRVFNCKFGIYTFKDKEGAEVKTNILKDASSVTEDQIAAIKDSLSVWKAEIAAKRGGGAADDFDPDSFVDE